MTNTQRPFHLTSVWQNAFEQGRALGMDYAEAGAYAESETIERRRAYEFEAEVAASPGFNPDMTHPY